ncbi:ECF transporter S component [Bifidobacterium olomucense]|uniref:ECF transporter, substrate-specific component n=1 Tax=Bifidobacterium olomucense TaxID=2675324 RepID=A0A7Y0EY95_9BIFI|nr:ECF transporter S component [Bifidobacterium sp. DSM 109959]NMM98338.1 ECF transporter, substrate-specific component [Bifidobacterium sp. DSM 109959]
MSVSSRIRMQFVRSVAPAAEGATSGASSTAKLGSHNTGVADSGRWSTRRIAMYALFVALAMVTSFIEFPITPVTWLKYDPSGIVCLIAGFAYGPSAAVIVSVLGFVPHMFADPWGSLMAVLVALCLSVPASLIYRKVRSRKGAALGILAGAVLAIVAALLGNLVVTPIYAHMSYAAVAAMILPILLPFNVAKMAIHAVVTFLIYKPISNLLAKQQ